MRALFRKLAGVLPALAAAAAVAAAVAAAPAAAQNYIVGPGDKLRISILGRDEFSGITEVRGDGSIQIHLLGRIEAAGRTLEDIEAQIVQRAGDRFDGAVSVVAGIAEYRPVFVLGNVQTPGSYPYAPGMTVIKAIALAGGYERAVAETSDDRAILDAQRRVVEAQIRLRFAEEEQRAVAAELERLQAGSPAAVAEIDPDQAELYRMGRAILEETIGGFRRKAALAEAETSYYSQRREIIGRQLKTIEKQLADINELVAQGLSRREPLVDLQVDVDNYRSDELETLAFAARAEQTGANAESEIGVAVSRYQRDLLKGKIEIDQQVALLRSNLNAAMDYLRTAAPALALSVGEEMVTVYEIYRGGTGSAPEQVELTSPMRPDDVLAVSFRGAAAGN